MRALWTIAILLLGPLAGAVSGRKLRSAPSRKLIYVGNAINLVVLAAITAAVDFTHGGRAFELLRGPVALPTLVMWSTGTAALCIAVVAVTLLFRVLLRR